MGSIKVLINEKQIEKRTEELAKQIYEDYKDKDFTALCALNGAMFFATELLKKIPLNIPIELIRPKSYIATETSGDVAYDNRFNPDLKDKNILVIEDVIDSGYTINSLVSKIKDAGANDVKVCVMLDKFEKREIPYDVDYTGFKIEDKFVIGYGLDYNENYRNLPYIAYVDGDIYVEKDYTNIKTKD